jgi:NADPH:quinone reductase-like Zn-dependent oxidoreductase
MTFQAWRYFYAAGEGLENSMSLQKDDLSTSALSKPHPGLVLVEVLSMSLNPADYKIAESWVGRIVTPKPASPGFDFCGRLMDGTDRRVVGRLDWPKKNGTLSQYILVKPMDFVDLPSTIPVETAAAIPTAALTAYQSTYPHIATGDRVFINGGSGGVGLVAIQLAKLFGAYVITSCSNKNQALCSRMGADETIDYTSEDIVQSLCKRGPIDLAIDNVGDDPQLHRKSQQFLKPRTGTFVLIAAMDQDVRGVMSMLDSWLRPTWLGGAWPKWRYYLCKTNQEQLRRVLRWVEMGKVKVTIDSVFDFKDAPDAYRRLKTGRARGKIVVRGASCSS